MTEVVSAFQQQVAAMMEDPESPLRRFIRAGAQLQVEIEAVKRDGLGEAATREGA